MDKTIHSKNYKILINLLRSKREERGITQTQLAELLGIEQAVLSKIETYERRLDIIELRTICAAMNISFINFIVEVESLFLPESVK